MASCITSMWSSSVCPQARLTVTQSSETNTTATLSWTLEYVTHGYTANTNGNDRAWSVTIDGSTVDSGGTNIDGKSTYTVASGTKTVSKAAARSVSFSLSFEFDLTWSGVYGGTKTASGSIGISAAKYTVSFNANGGNLGNVSSTQTKTHGVNLILDADKPTRSDYTFQGWGTSTTDTTVDYAAGDSYTNNASDTLYAIWKKTITLTYDDNGGSGAPSATSQSVYNATTSYTFTISSTKPTRTGYTFLGWSTSSSATSASYSGGDNITLSSSDTLYAVWRENILTVIYYGNKADGCKYKGNVVSIDSSKEASEILVDSGALSSEFYYNTAATTGLADMQNSSYLHLTKTGWSSLGEWNTASDGSGKAVGEKEVFDTGQELAVALGTTLASKDITVYVYAQWEENTLTVKYHSNFATSAFDGALNEVSADENVIVNTHDFGYEPDEYYSTYGLGNYSHSSGGLYMTRTRYDATGYWCTTANELEIEGISEDRDNVITYDGGIAIGENLLFDSGQELAEYLGLTLEDGSKTINLYAHWVLLCSYVTVYLPNEDGEVVPHRGMVHIYDDKGDLHYGIVYLYDSEGNARVVI